MMLAEQVDKVLPTEAAAETDLEVDPPQVALSRFPPRADFTWAASLPNVPFLLNLL